MPTCSVSFCQAKRAVQRGATAVIFDVSENPEAIDQVNPRTLPAPHPPERSLWVAWPVTVMSASSQGLSIVS